MPDIKNLLKARSMKTTPQRVAVYEAMTALGHAGAEAVSDWIKENSQTRVSPASVYNILGEFADSGILSRVASTDSRMVFDVNTSYHLHLYDTRSSEFKDVDNSELIEAVGAVFKKRRFRGYSIEQVDVQIICRPTRLKREDV